MSQSFRAKSLALSWFSKYQLVVIDAQKQGNHHRDDLIRNRI